MFVIVVVHIPCPKLFQGMECGVLLVVMCTKKIKLGHIPNFRITHLSQIESSIL